jgi:hypothetical protein
MNSCTKSSVFLLTIIVFCVVSGGSGSLVSTARAGQVERIVEINRYFSRYRIPLFFCYTCWFKRWHVPRLAKLPSRSGPLNTASIERIMKRNRYELIRCVDWSVIAQPSVTTSLNLKFVIQPDGEVGKVTIETGKQKLPHIRKCLTRKIKRLLFPRPEGFDPVEVHYPLVFAY